MKILFLNPKLHCGKYYFSYENSSLYSFSDFMKVTVDIYGYIETIHWEYNVVPRYEKLYL